MSQNNIKTVEITSPPLACLKD